MDFNGNDIITITLKMWELNKARLASDYLFIDKSNLSRKQPFRYNSTEFYKKVFDPCNEKSPAYKEGLENEYSKEYKKHAENLLEDLKEIIKVSGYEDVLKDIWNKEYKEFVIAMLKKANLQPSQKRSSSSNRQSKNAEALMIKMFEHTVIQWDIIITINQLRDDSFNTSAEEKFTSFKTAIEAEMEKNFTEHKNEIIYDKIMEFTHLLFDYLKWLEPMDENSMFAAYCSYQQKSDYIPKRLKILYHDICGGKLFQ